MLIVVDTLGDPLENLPETNPCHPHPQLLAQPHKDVGCSLRLAIDIANSELQPNWQLTILLPPGIIHLSSPLPEIHCLTNVQLTIQGADPSTQLLLPSPQDPTHPTPQDPTQQDPNAPSRPKQSASEQQKEQEQKQENSHIVSLIDGAGSYRIFSIALGTSVFLKRLKLQNGKHTHGGAMMNSGELIGEDLECSHNRAVNGGCLYNAGSLRVTRAKLFDNRASNCGGGVYIEQPRSGVVTIAHTHFDSNHDHCGHLNSKFHAPDNPGPNNQLEFSPLPLLPAPGSSAVRAQPSEPRGGPKQVIDAAGAIAEGETLSEP